MESQHRFWGPVTTILWGVFVLIAFAITQAITVVVYILLTRGAVSGIEASTLIAQLRYDGRLLAWCTFATTIVCGGATLFVVKLKQGSNLKDYLGLTLPSRRQFFGWLVVLIAFIGLSDGVSIFLGKSIVPEFMVETYGSLHSHWILWLALLIAAPLFEELFFRGFLIKGLSVSTLRWYGAVIISAAAWALIHVQYDLYGVVTVFVLGLILGAARAKTGSTILTMCLHSFSNLIATTEVVFHLRGVSG